MQALSLSLSSPVLPLRPHKIRFGQRIRTRLPTKIMASRRDAYGFGGNVDEDMIVLRMRIHEMKMAETDYKAPEDWMEWEKKYCGTGRYYSDICEAVGFLQSCLMETRPGLALAMVALVMLSVPTSMAVVLFKLMEIAVGF